MRILIVEDDRKLVDFLSRAFTDEGHQADRCSSGSEALIRAASNAYDVIVLDWLLPGMDGLAVCQALRAEGNRVPILMLTACADLNARVTALNAGVDDYLTKPFHLAELCARVRSLSRRSEGREGRSTNTSPGSDSASAYGGPRRASSSRP
jgi:DNA-binding response OmpR family regulator